MTRDEQRALSLLGIAMRAGQVVSGDSLCERELRAGRSAMVLLDAGASQNTRDKYSAMCAHREVPLFLICADALGRAIGRENRMVAVLPKGTLTEKIGALLSGGQRDTINNFGGAGANVQSQGTGSNEGTIAEREQAAGGCPANRPERG